MIWIKTNVEFQIDDIIKYKVGGLWIYSKIVHLTNSTIRVINLDMVHTPNGKYNFIENNTINPTTKNNISIYGNGYSRRALYKLSWD